MSAADEWRHVSNPKERKRIQNRLSQRNVRRKKKQTSQDSESPVDYLPQAANHPPASFVSNWVCHNTAFSSQETSVDPSLQQSIQDQLQDDDLIRVLDSPLDSFPTGGLAHALLSNTGGSSGTWNELGESISWSFPKQPCESHELSGINANCADAVVLGSSLPCLNCGSSDSSAASSSGHHVASPGPRRTMGPTRSNAAKNQGHMNIFTQSNSNSNNGTNRLSGHSVFSPSAVTQQHQCACKPPHVTTMWKEQGIKTKEAVLADVKEMLNKHGMNISDVADSIVPSFESSSESGSSSRRDSYVAPPVRHVIAERPTGSQLAQILADSTEENLEKVVILYLRGGR